MQSESPPPRRKKKDTDPISAAIRNARRNWAAQIESPGFAGARSAAGRRGDVDPKE